MYPRIPRELFALSLWVRPAHFANHCSRLLAGEPGASWKAEATLGPREPKSKRFGNVAADLTICSIFLQRNCTLCFYLTYICSSRCAKQWRPRDGTKTRSALNYAWLPTCSAEGTNVQRNIRGHGFHRSLQLAQQNMAWVSQRVHELLLACRPIALSARALGYCGVHALGNTPRAAE
jgi:hypothetical protein